MSKTRIILLLVLIALLFLLPTKKARGDSQIQLSSTQVVLPPVEVIQIPSKLPEQYVEYYLMVYEEFHDDAPVMIEIARAESGFNPQAKNPASTAKGLFQILGSTYKAYNCTGDVLNAADNIACARIIYEKDGTTPWNESKSSWSK